MKQLIYLKELELDDNRTLIIRSEENLITCSSMLFFIASVP